MIVVIVSHIFKQVSKQVRYYCARRTRRLTSIKDNNHHIQQTQTPLIQILTSKQHSEDKLGLHNIHRYISRCT